MRKIMRRLFSIVSLVLIISCMMGVKSYASSEYPYAFDFDNQVLNIKAGSYADVTMWSRWDYTYYISNHTSKKTYIDCKWVAGNEIIRVYVGEDEQAKDITFYFYVDQDHYRCGDDYATILVRVKDTKPGMVVEGVDTLKTYAGNNAEFNAYYYFVNYTDLQAAFGLNGDALLKHYNTFGKAEGRVANKLK